MDNPEKVTIKPVFFVTVVSVYILPLVLFWITSFFQRNDISRYLFTVLGSLTAFAIAFWAIHNDNTVSFEEIGWSTKHLQQTAWILLIGWAILAFVIISINFKMGHPFSDSFESQPLFVLQQWLFVGLAEELLFRGYILTKIIKSFSKQSKLWANTIGLVMSSLIFATFHIPQRISVEGMSLAFGEILWNMLPLFIVGILFSWLFLRSDNVILVGLIHGGTNAPLLGRKSDLVPLLLFIILLETIHWIKIFQNRRKQNNGF